MSTASVPVLTLDGPSGSGKGTISRILAQRLGWRLLDSGALYRLVALAAERHQVALDDEPALATLAAALEVDFIVQGEEPGADQVLLEGSVVGPALRSERCGNAASRLAALPAVRAALLVSFARAVASPSSGRRR